MIPGNMRLSWREFLSRRRMFNTQFFRHPNPTPHSRTILLCSHVWWTEHIALSLFNLGHHVLVHQPFYLLTIDPKAAVQFDGLWDATLKNIRDCHVDLIIGGNSTAILPHKKTGALLHEAARPDHPIPMVNWWWDEPRNRPAFATAEGHGKVELSPRQYVALLANPHSLNALWDIDVLEELNTAYGLTNLFHLPLATLPEFWHTEFIPLEKRPLAACFVGNCHFTADWAETDQDPLIAWARNTALMKIAAPNSPMQACMDRTAQALGGPPVYARTLIDGDDWLTFTRPWEILNAAYMHFTRNRLVAAAERHLKGKLALIGKGWNEMGLRANMEHAGTNTARVYAQSKASLNLFGGCVHGGMPLRPYDLTASGGLLVTHDQRERPDLFPPDTCLHFVGEGPMLEHLDHIFKSPADFNPIAHAGHAHTLAHHTWDHRVKQLLTQVDRRFGPPQPW